MEVFGILTDLKLRSADRGTDTASPDAPFDQLFDRYYRRVVAFFARRRYSSAESHELAQETFLRICKRWLQERNERKLTEALLFTTAVNVLRNDVRERTAQKRLDAHQRVPLDEVLEADSDGSPLDKVLAEERKHLVQKAIETLPVKMRRCTRLWIKEMSHKEIADVLRITPGAVGAHLHQARRKLKDELAEHFDDLSCLD